MSLAFKQFPPIFRVTQRPASSFEPRSGSVGQIVSRLAGT